MRKPKFFESPYLNMRIFTGITMGNSCYEIEISWDDNITKIGKWKNPKNPQNHGWLMGSPTLRIMITPNI